MAKIKYPVDFENGIPHKKCTVCLERQEVKWANFRPHPTYEWGYAKCRRCESLERKAYRKKRIEQYRAYDKARKYKQHGLTELQWRSMYEAQQKCCAICKKESDIDDLKIDHCHDSGAVRGLLCNSCNVALGMMEDDVDRFKTAIEYILVNRSQHSH